MSSMPAPVAPPPSAIILAVSNLPLDFVGGAELALHELLAEGAAQGLPIVHYHPGAKGQTTTSRGVAVFGLDAILPLDVAAVLVNRGGADDSNAQIFAAFAKQRGIPLFQWMHDFYDTVLPGARAYAASRAHALASGLGAADVLTPLAVTAPPPVQVSVARPALLGPQVFAPSTAIGKGGDTAMALAAWVDGWYEGKKGGEDSGTRLGQIDPQAMAGCQEGDLTLVVDRPHFWIGGAGAVAGQVITRPRNVVNFARMGSSWGQADFRELLAGMDLALVPTRQETFCRTIAECFELGIPVVASSLPALVEEFSAAAVLVHPDAPPRVWWRACLSVLREGTAGREARRARGLEVVVKLRARARQQRDVLFAEWARLVRDAGQAS